MKIIPETIFIAKSLISQLNPSVVGKRMAKNSIWSISGSVVAQASSLVVTIISARLLGKTGFGELGLINSTILFLCLVVNFGLALTSFKYIAEHFNKDKVKTGKFIGFIYSFSLISSLLFFVLYVIILFKIPVILADAPQLSLQMQICGVVVVLYSLINSQTSILMGFEAFTQIAKINIIRGIILLAFSTICIYFWNLNGAIIGLIIEGIIAILVNHLFTQKFAKENSIKIQWNLTKEYKPLIVNFSLPAFLSSLIVPFTIWIGNTMLTNSPDGFSELGQFNAAFQWRNLVLFIPLTLGNATLPIITSETADRKIESANKVVKVAMVICGLSSLFVALILILGGNFFMSVFGKDFGSDPNTFILLILSSIIAATISPVGSWIIANNKMWLALLMNAGWGLALILSAVVLIGDNHGALGLSVSFLIAYILHACWTLGYYLKISKANPI